MNMDFNGWVGGPGGVWMHLFIIIIKEIKKGWGTPICF